MSADKQVVQAYRHLPLTNQQWINDRVAWILGQFGKRHIVTCPVVLPTSPLLASYPVDNLDEMIVYCQRVVETLDLDPKAINIQFASKLLTDDGKTALGLYWEAEGKFSIALDDSQLEKPNELTSTLVHELCHVHLMGHRRIDEDEPDNEPLTDLLAVFWGYGILLANSVVYDSHFTFGTYGEYAMERRGYLTMSMFGYALALLAKMRNEDGSQWRQHMRPDVRDAFKASLRFFDQHGLPDLTKIPTSFSMPEINAPERNEEAFTNTPFFFPPGYEPDEIEEATDYSIDNLQQQLNAQRVSHAADTELLCIYCDAPALGPDDAPVCQLCQASIDEGQDELAEERDEALDGVSPQKAFVHVTVGFCLIVLVIFLIRWCFSE